MSMLYASPEYYSDSSSPEKIVLISRDKKYCFYFNEVASFLWPLLQKGADSQTMKDAVCRHFSVTPKTAEKDIRSWIQEGLKEGYITREKPGKKPSLFVFLSKIFSKFR